MNIAAQVAVLVVALLHLYFLALEMFLWNKPLGRKIFRLTPEFAQQSAGLAANQGLYNGFLAAGLVWSVVAGAMSFPLKLFFLSCVIVAGVFGAVTVNRRILLIQALPALVAMILVHLAR
ncbi:MAG: DUF1304 domain-containing protein [Acidobacteriota bacterium]